MYSMMVQMVEKDIVAMVFACFLSQKVSNYIFLV
jgi:hypothetical protein